MAQPAQRYKVLERIAAGGMAEVFRAESAGLEGFKKLVAIKRVLPHLSEKKQFIGMFLDEARVCAHLSHSNCVQVFDIGVGDNTYFIVMEFVDGSDLKGVIEGRKKFGQPFPVEEATLISVRICEGLSYAHELVDSKGNSLHIVHRDMSPPNVLLTRFGEVKIVDFGLAKANSQLERSEPGIIKGKFSYLSPEAAEGQPVDARTDVFAVGIILWEMLAGRRLFLGESDLETVRMVQRAEIPSLREFNPKVPAELERVLAKGLAREPAKRYQTAREFGRDLNQILFRLGRAVSSYEVSQLVLPIWRERQQKKRDKVDKGAIIGSLIDEALFEFSSLESGDRASKSIVGAVPVSIGSFEDVHNWGDEMAAEPRNSLPDMPLSYELGNLAALEDDDDPRNTSIPAKMQLSLQPTPRHSIASKQASLQPTPRHSLASTQASPEMPRAPSVVAPPPVVIVEPPLAPVPPAPAKNNKMVGIVVAVALVAAAAGAWFGGVIPH